MLWQPRGLIQTGQHWRRPQTTGGAWVPTDLGANLIAWFKADAGVYNDAGTTLATDSQTVQQWNDQSGNGYHLLQATSEDRPTYNATGFNGGKTVTFNVTNTEKMRTVVDSVAMGAVATGSAFIVGQMLTGTSAYGRAVSYMATSATEDYDSTGSAAWLLRQNANNTIATFRNGAERCTAAISLATNYRLGIIYDGSNATPYVNNVAGTPVAYTTSWGSPGSLSIGADYGGGGSTYWSGPVSEVVITNSALSSGDRDSLDGYFTTKWGL